MFHVSILTWGKVSLIWDLLIGYGSDVIAEEPEKNSG